MDGSDESRSALIVGRKSTLASYVNVINQLANELMAKHQIKVQVGSLDDVPESRRGEIIGASSLQIPAAEPGLGDHAYSWSHRRAYDTWCYLHAKEPYQWIIFLEPVSLYCHYAKAQGLAFESTTLIDCHQGERPPGHSIERLMDDALGRLSVCDRYWWADLSAVRADEVSAAVSSVCYLGDEMVLERYAVVADLMAVSGIACHLVVPPSINRDDVVATLAASCPEGVQSLLTPAEAPRDALWLLDTREPPFQLLAFLNVPASVLLGPASGEWQAHLATFPAVTDLEELPAMLTGPVPQTIVEWRTRSTVTVRESRTVVTVTVCMTHKDRPQKLRRAVESLLAQTDPAFEVILIDDGSSSAAALALLDELEVLFGRKHWRIFRQPNQYVGAARNRAAREASTSHILFMDDDNLLEPIAIETYKTAVEHAVEEAFSCVAGRFFEAPSRLADAMVPLGGDLVAAAVQNTLGDTNTLFRRDAFLSVGGFHEARRVGIEDYELLVRFVAAGFNLAVIPLMLVRYDASADSITNDQFPAFVAERRMLASLSKSMSDRETSMINLIHHRFHREKVGEIHPLAAGVSVEDGELVHQSAPAFIKSVYRFETAAFSWLIRAQTALLLIVVRLLRRGGGSPR